MLDAKLAPGEDPEVTLWAQTSWDVTWGAALIYGARTALFISLIALGTGAFVGTVLGLVAVSAAGGWTWFDHARLRRRPGVPNHPGGDDHCYDSWEQVLKT